MIHLHCSFTCCIASLKAGRQLKLSNYTDKSGLRKRTDFLKVVDCFVVKKTRILETYYKLRMV